MKSKLLSKKGIIIAVFVVIVLNLGCIFANINIVRPRVEQMKYNEEYGTDISSDGLYVIKYEPSEKSGKVADISRYYGADYGLDKAIIPSSTNGIKCRAITEQSFSNSLSLKSIIISNGITIINSNAFFNCENLEKLFIPKSVVKIDSSAISKCNKLTVYVEKGSAAESYVKNNNLKYTYYKSKDKSVGKSNEKVIINGEYKDYQYNTFIINGKLNCAITRYNTSNSTAELNVPDKISDIPVTAISAEAFMHGQAIKSIKLPNSVKTIGHDAFSDCPLLEKIYIDKGISYIDKTAKDGSDNAKFIMY